jgi:hypothetical protein
MEAIPHLVIDEEPQTPVVPRSSIIVGEMSSSVTKKSALATPLAGSSGGPSRLPKVVSLSDLNQCYMASHTLEELYPAEDERYNLVDMIPDGDDKSAHGSACVSFAGMDKSSLNPESMTKLLANEGDRYMHLSKLRKTWLDRFLCYKRVVVHTYIDLNR